MTEVHKIVCDVCGEEKDLNAIRLGGVDTWQTIEAEVHSFGRRTIRHACSSQHAVHLLENPFKEDDIREA